MHCSLMSLFGYFLCIYSKTVPNLHIFEILAVLIGNHVLHLEHERTFIIIQTPSTQEDSNKWLKTSKLTNFPLHVQYLYN